MTMTEKTINEVTNLEQFDEFYKGSYYTITGAGGPLEEWTKGYEELLQKENIGTPTEWYTFKGSQMNEKYSLSGSIAYQDDLTFIAFPLTGLDGGKLAIFKLKMQDRWFDDIVDNNERHMKGW